MQYIKTELQNQLVGGRLSKITMPFSDEILLSFYCEKTTKNLTLSANANLCRACLTTQKFQNPLNSFNFLNLLRKHLTNAVLHNIEQQKSERVLNFVFSCKNELFDTVERTICFEWMGRVSNILLLDQNKKILGAIHTSSLDGQEKRKIIVGFTYEQLVCDKIAFDDYEKIQQEKYDDIVEFLTTKVAGISKQTAQILREEMENTQKSLVEVLKNPPQKLKISGTQVEDELLAKSQQQRKNEKAKPYATLLKVNLNRLLSKIKKLEQTLLESKDSEKYRIKGELVTNNIFNIKRGEKTAKVFDYYQNCDVEIALDEKLSPQENAKKYFKKAQKLKNASKISQTYLDEANTLLQELLAVQYSLSIAETNEEMEEVGEELSRLKILKISQSKKQKHKETEFMHFEDSGFDIYVGKNNIQNAKLVKLANGNDIWLHAQNVAGSHGIIVCKNTVVPQNVLNIASQIVAYYSKNRQNTKVPVDYTLAKYVKNVPNSPLGFVTFTNNKTLIVEPKLPTQNTQNNNSK